jgi:hypothetical protein
MMTTLSCNDVNVEYYGRLPFDTHAIAAIDVRGDYLILVDPIVRKETVGFKKRLMVHEIAHLLVYEIDPTNNTHDEVFDGVCEELSTLMEVKPNKACSQHSGTPSYWNPRANVHYKRD